MISGCVLRSSARAASPCEIACLYWAVVLDDPSGDDDGEGAAAAAAAKMPSQSSSIGNRSSGDICCPCYFVRRSKKVKVSRILAPTVTLAPLTKKMSHKRI